MSIRAKITEVILKSMKTREIFDLPDDELFNKVIEMNKKRGLRTLKLDDRCRDEMIMEKYHCVRIRPKKGGINGAVLFIFGGGNMVDCDNGDISVAKRIADTKNVEVWFPCYPLLTDHSMTDTVEMLYEVYSRMLNEYSHDKITFLGFSSGAAQSLILCEYNNALGKKLPMPKQVIAVSPGSCCDDADIKESLRELDKKDVMIPSSFLGKVRKMIEQHGEDIPEYMICTEKGDLSGVPMIHFFYGAYETLYAVAPKFEENCQKHNVPYTMTVGKGMFHCYPMFTFYPEGKQGFNEILGYI